MEKAQVVQAFKFRLKPTGSQVQQMKRFEGCARYTYNQGLDFTKQIYAETGKFPNYQELCKNLTIWRNSEETPWLAEAPVHTQQQKLRDLRRALFDFVKGGKGFPHFKKKGVSRASFRYPDPKQIELDQGNSRVQLPKLGWVRYFKSRKVPGTLKNVTVSNEGDHWYISITTRREENIKTHPSSSLVGLDAGIVNFAVLSDGEVIEPANPLKKHLTKLERAQRNLARKKKGSNNYKKAKKRVAKIHRKVARIREDFLHKTTHTISKNHAYVAVENLNIKGMSASTKGTVENPGKNVRQKAGLNRAILDQGWGAMKRMLKYKLELRGGEYREVNPAGTSITCPTLDGGCGNVDKDNRVTRAKFKCTECGYAGNADRIGALNVLERALIKDKQDRPAGSRQQPDGEVALEGPSVKQEPTEATIDSSCNAT